MTDVAEELARLGELSAHDLRVAWRRHQRGDPPNGFSRDHLVRAIAYRIQEQAFGGLSQALKRALMGMMRNQTSKGDVTPTHPAVLSPGVRLVRSWHGETHAVLVLPDGFEYRDQRYRSLTQVAKLITGAHWSGPRFFGTVTVSAATVDRVKAPRTSGSEAAPHHG